MKLVYYNIYKLYEKGEYNTLIDLLIKFDIRINLNDIDIGKLVELNDKKVIYVIDCLFGCGCRCNNSGRDVLCGDVKISGNNICNNSVDVKIIGNNVCNGRNGESNYSIKDVYNGNSKKNSTSVDCILSRGWNVFNYEEDCTVHSTTLNNTKSPSLSNTSCLSLHNTKSPSITHSTTVHNTGYNTLPSNTLHSTSTTLHNTKSPSITQRIVSKYKLYKKLIPYILSNNRNNLINIFIKGAELEDIIYVYKNMKMYDKLIDLYVENDLYVEYFELVDRYYSSRMYDGSVNNVVNGESINVSGNDNRESINVSGNGDSDRESNDKLYNNINYNSDSTVNDSINNTIDKSINDNSNVNDSTI
ncbi:hypothetical protein NAPIS_ORF02666 [Vairimorpha apis BRL 01]|uniref:Uncharacterized protein n=1 Tax=Vairimorpha apis BRL 01 TaxID=1037528 RepID=T0KW99_9MICR|nr:hypothetical protein NAPIS_ORF02666 [Vairimorpha apis BRL 01]